MLTKDLVQITTRNGKAFPKLVKLTDEKARSDAQDICAVFKESTGRPLGGLEEELKATCSTPRRRALAKLLIDRCQIVEPDPQIMEFRWKVFELAENMRQTMEGRLDVFSVEVAKKMELSVHELREKLFSDLPSSRVIEKFSPVEPEALLELLNVAQIKTILCFAQHVCIRLAGCTLAQKRELMRQMKFYRLIGEPSFDKNENMVIVNLSGPLSQYGIGSGYGLRVANFFGFISSLPNWSLEAEIKWKNKVLTMSLDTSSGVSSKHSKANGAYLPKEFQQVLGALRSDVSFDAKLGEDLINLGDGDQFFPDLVFECDGRKIAIELFHGSHRGQLERRLRAASRLNCSDFRIGVEKSLLKDRQLAKELNENIWYKKFGFEFNQFPTPSLLKKAVFQHG